MSLQQGMFGLLMQSAAGGGGIPSLDGRAVAMGQFSVETQTNSYTVNHGMGVAPEYVLVVIEGDETTSNHITGMLVNPYGALAVRRGSSGWTGSTFTPQIDSTSFVVQSSATAHVLSAGATFYWIALGPKS